MCKIKTCAIELLKQAQESILTANVLLPSNWGNWQENLSDSKRQRRFSKTIVSFKMLCKSQI